MSSTLRSNPGPPSPNGPAMNLLCGPELKILLAAVVKLAVPFMSLIHGCGSSFPILAPATEENTRAKQASRPHDSPKPLADRSPFVGPARKNSLGPIFGRLQ